MMLNQGFPKRLISKVVLSFILMTTSVSVYSFSLDELLLSISSNESFEVGFKEEKADPFFDVPFLSSGTVAFKAPSYVKKTVNKPSKQFFELDGDVMTISLKENKKQIFLVSEQPDMVAFFESFRSILAGDKVTLQKHFKVSLSGDLNQWSLSLKPLSKRLSYRIDQIIFSGQSGQILQVETAMGNGSSSHLFMDITKHDEQ